MPSSCVMTNCLHRRRKRLWFVFIMLMSCRFPSGLNRLNRNIMFGEVNGTRDFMDSDQVKIGYFKRSFKSQIVSNMLKCLLLDHRISTNKIHMFHYKIGWLSTTCRNYEGLFFLSSVNIQMYTGEPLFCIFRLLSEQNIITVHGSGKK